MPSPAGAEACAGSRDPLENAAQVQYGSRPGELLGFDGLDGMSIRSLALRIAKAVARPVVACMPAGVQVRARRIWTRLKEEPSAARESERRPELTLAAAEVWQDLVAARAVAGREPRDGVPSAEPPRGRRAGPA
jgi:hypothetical protein